MTGAALSIRAARTDDIGFVQELEIDAGRRFYELGLDAIAESDPPTGADLQAHIDSGTIWIAVQPTVTSEVLVGYATASVVDDEGHLDQVSVAFDAQGGGIGRALVEKVCSWAAGLGFEAVTLTTFADVAWNGPLYTHLGFDVVAGAGLGPELAAIRAAEREAGLDVLTRVAMRRVLP